MNECKFCGVAYDMGKRSCSDLECKKKTRNCKQTSIKPYDLIKARYFSIKQRAHRKQVDFDLTLKQLTRIIQTPCIYCLSTSTIEVDRKDNSLGYTEKNCVPACRRCNTVKNNVVTYDEMLFIAKYLGWRVST